jgi:hypothetical protein
MKNIWTLCGVVLAITVSQSAFAGHSYPKPINDAVANYASQCKEGGLKLVLSKSFIREANLTGDGMKNYILDEVGAGASPNVSCTGSPDFFFGSNGGSATIYTETKDGGAKTIYEGTGGLTLVGNKVTASFRDADCGPTANKNPQSEADVTWCSRQLNWNPIKQEMEPGKIVK